MSNEKLDSLSKILVATSAINYMANTLFSVNQQMRQVVHLKPELEKVHGSGMDYRDSLLANTVVKLGQIMEELGNCMNEQDCISPIDVRITKEAFSIILEGNDDVEQEIIPTPPMVAPLSVLVGKSEVFCNKCRHEEIPNKEFVFSGNLHVEERILEQLDHCKKCGHLIQTTTLHLRDAQQEKEQKESFTKAGIKFTDK